MKVVKLQGQTGYMLEVARMIYDEFVVKTKSKATLNQIIDYLSHPNENQMPYTLMALEAEKCIGTVSLFELDIKDRPEYSPCLASLCVNQNYRSQGIGTKLIDEIGKVANELGYKEIFLKTETAKDYYIRLGWAFLETVTDDDGEESYIFKIGLDKKILIMDTK